MINKKQARLRRARKTRIKIAMQDVCRLVFHRSNQHVYAQLYSTCGTQVLASASTLDAEVKQMLDGKIGANVNSAALVGKVIAKRIIDKEINFVAFDRSGRPFHGVVKALADAVNEGGVNFKKALIEKQA